MKYLLDTHTFIWAVQKSNKLSKKIKTIITNTNNEIFVSTVSFWEISLKEGYGKMVLENIKPEDLPQCAKDMDFKIISLQENESATFHELPLKENHKDPFDRMLIWQAITKNITLISKDDKFEQYKKNGLKIIW